MLNFPWKWSIEVTKPLLIGLLIFFVVVWLTESWRRFLWFCFACGNNQKLCIAAYLLKYGLHIYGTSNPVFTIPQTPYPWYHKPTFFWSSSVNGEPTWQHPQRAEIGSSEIPLLHEYCWNKHMMPADGNISKFSVFWGLFAFSVLFPFNVLHFVPWHSPFSSLTLSIMFLKHCVFCSLTLSVLYLNHVFCSSTLSFLFLKHCVFCSLTSSVLSCLVIAVAVWLKTEACC